MKKSTHMYVPCIMLPHWGLLRIVCIQILPMFSGAISKSETKNSQIAIEACMYVTYRNIQISDLDTKLLKRKMKRK